jgi:phosphatidylinositol alpha-1,6-mannosyltransferase
LKKILMLTTEFPPKTGGIGTYCHQLASAAAKRGHEITVFAPDLGKAPGDIDDSLYPFRVVRYEGGEYTIRDFPRYFRQVWQQVRSDSWDVVHAADWPSALMMRNVNRFRRIPYRQMVHGTDVLLMPESRQIKLLGSHIFEFPYRITTNSEFTRSLLLEKFPAVDPARVDVALLGVGPEWFEPVPDPASVLERYEVPADRFLMLTVARLDLRKGHRLILQALRELPAEMASNMAYVAVGAGDPEYLAQLRRLAEDSPVPVIFTGPIADDDLKAMYAAADLFVMPGEPHPRRVEGFGLVYLEAAAQGVPSIASAVGAIPEVVIDGETGLVIPPADEPALKAAIERLFGDRELLSRLGSRAQERSREFTWDRCAELTYEK